MTRQFLLALAATLMTLTAFSGTIRILTFDAGPVQVA